MARLTAAQKRLLTAAELSRVESACEKHTDVARLVKDLRAVRALRQKQRDNLGKQVRAVKAGTKRPTRQMALNDRSHQKEVLFDGLVKQLEQRLETLRDTAAAECSARKETPRLTQAKRLLTLAVREVETDASSLFESNSLNGKLVDAHGVGDEIKRLNALATEIHAFLKKR